MYNFIDVTEVSEESILPSEALKINGRYIEDLICGYRTLNVSGREALSPDVISYTTGVRDGSKLKSRRFPERIIVVTYMIAAETNEAFREAYNKLAGILNVENAQLIFNDEQDKFFIGTPCIIGSVEPGKNYVTGKFEILCTDPFKYSVVEYEAQPNIDNSSILIDYGGTYKAFPTLQADFYKETEVADDGVTAGTLTGNGDCGYVAFFNENKKIIQLGDPDQVDGESYPKSQTLINQTFMGSTAWGTTAKNLWSVNNGNLMSNTVQVGSVQMALAEGSESEAESGTILNTKSTAGAPVINYKVSAKVSERKETSVKLDIAVTASLATATNYFGHGYILDASVYVGGAWHSVTLKKANERWEGQTGHTVNLPVTITGITNSQTSLTGIKFKVERADSYGSAGKLAETNCNNIPIGAVGQESTNYFLTPASYGTDSAHWHGPCLTRSVGADAAGEVGARNFTLTYKQKMCMGNGTEDTKQMGGFQMHLLTENGANIAGVRVYKNTAGKTGKLVFYVGGRIVNTTDIDLHYNNYYFGSDVDSVQTTTIRKHDHEIVFSVGNYVRKFREPRVANLSLIHI